jgi:hypothetical protein
VEMATFTKWWESREPKMEVRSMFVMDDDEKNGDKNKHTFFVEERVRVKIALESKDNEETYRKTLSKASMRVQFNRFKDDDDDDETLLSTAAVTNITCKLLKGVGYVISADTIVPKIRSGDVRIQVTLSLPSCTSLNLTASSRSISHLSSEEITLRSFMRDAAGAFANVDLQSKRVSTIIRVLDPIRVHNVNFVPMSVQEFVCSIVLECVYDDVTVEIYSVGCVRSNGTLQIETMKKPVQILPFEKLNFNLDMHEDHNNVDCIFVRWGTKSFASNRYIETHMNLSSVRKRTTTKVDVLVELSLPQSAKLHKTILVRACATNMTTSPLDKIVLSYSSHDCKNASWICLSPRIKLSKKLLPGMSEQFKLRLVKLCESHLHEKPPMLFQAFDNDGVKKKDLICKVRVRLL